MDPLAAGLQLQAMNDAYAARTVVLAADTSLTGTGLFQAVLSPWGNRFTVATLRSPKPKPGDTNPKTTSRRITYLTDRIEAAILDPEHPATHLAIEELAYGAKGDAKSKLDWLWGDVVHLAAKHDLPLLVVSVGTVKKFATGNGNADKDEVMLSMASKFPHIGIRNNNESDAAAVGMIACRTLGQPVDTMPAKHLERGKKAKELIWQ